jgi:hypothetical protein
VESVITLLHVDLCRTFTHERRPARAITAIKIVLANWRLLPSSLVPSDTSIKALLQPMKLCERIS